ncbi:Flp pilus assembly protein, pilin Flp [Altererythrobacter epoxidivorans]|uniref:Flp pilus assembly protein, pilin Flp n=1 Tax=Altererythrobacter epoxidivorans TaxID=361183 RepID=A0A0M4M7Z6_9SPHN|nr:Flp family type IVb pilin [Altererythrobacter epoxidivorans]ALE16660.1 Flp pilus assembly protein, pilin Flp [Altererythrobacter epoxidivorans]
MLRNLWLDESGATAIEYGLLVALLSIACITALQAVGNELSTTMSTVSTTLDGNNTIS